MKNEFKAGDSVLFKSTDSERNGAVVSAIVKDELSRDLYDKEDVGPMYVITTEDGKD